MFDVAALEHVDQLAVAKERDGRRRGVVAGEVGASAIGGFGVLAGEHGEQAVRLGTVLERAADGGTHAAGGASADGIHDDHGGALLSGEFAIHVGGGLQFLNSQAGEFLAHGDY